MASNGNGGGVKGFVAQGFMGALAGFIGDGLTEVSRLPVLNDPAPIGGAQVSNFELVANGAGVIMSALGFIDLVTKRSIGGIGKSLLPTGLGLLIGVQQYENWGAQTLGIRK